MDIKKYLQVFRPYEVSGLVRLGSKYDGGYVVHEPSLNDVECLVNYGVGYNIDFECDFFRRRGAQTLAFDPTLNDTSKLRGLLSSFAAIRFLSELKYYSLWMIKKRSVRKYNIRLIDEGLSNKISEKYKTLASHLSEYNLLNKRIMLKIDIEGAEYDVFEDDGIYSYLPNAVQIVLEFHDLKNNFEKVHAIMSRINDTHTLIHIHANNHGGCFDFGGKEIPELIELTYLLNRYLPVKAFSQSDYPVAGLDQPSHKRKADLPLSFFK